MKKILRALLKKSLKSDFLTLIPDYSRIKDHFSCPAQKNFLIAKVSTLRNVKRKDMTVLISGPLKLSIQGYKNENAIFPLILYQGSKVFALDYLDKIQRDFFENSDFLRLYVIISQKKKILKFHSEKLTCKSEKSKFSKMPFSIFCKS